MSWTRSGLPAVRAGGNGKTAVRVRRERRTAATARKRAGATWGHRALAATAGFRRCSSGRRSRSASSKSTTRRSPGVWTLCRWSSANDSSSRRPLIHSGNRLQMTLSRDPVSIDVSIGNYKNHYTVNTIDIFYTSQIVYKVQYSFFSYDNKLVTFSASIVIPSTLSVSNMILNHNHNLAIV